MSTFLGYEDVVRVLIELGANVNPANIEKPIHKAAYNGKPILALEFILTH